MDLRAREGADTPSVTRERAVSGRPLIVRLLDMLRCRVCRRDNESTNTQFACAATHARRPPPRQSSLHTCKCKRKVDSGIYPGASAVASQVPSGSAASPRAGFHTGVCCVCASRDEHLIGLNRSGERTCGIGFSRFPGGRPRAVQRSFWARGAMPVPNRAVPSRRSSVHGDRRRRRRSSRRWEG